MTEETWKPWPTDPRYLVSDQGRVRGIKGQLLKNKEDDKGRWRVSYIKDGKRRTRQVHQMVLETFVGPCPPGLETRHLNGKPHDNWLANLVYGTKQQNAADRIAHGRSPQGATHNRAKLFGRDVLAIRAAYPVKTLKELAEEYGLGITTVRAIIVRRTWRHLP
jgi:hypothetical protein